ncbi:extensin family protein, partial [Acinetobacter baumannii]
PPGQQAAVTPAEQPSSAKSLFLRAVHDKACLRFGTTLGPEANAAHRNHLHVDMAERKFKKICDN